MLHVAITEEIILCRSQWKKFKTYCLSLDVLVSNVKSHFQDSHVTYGANNVHLVHSFHNRWYVLLLELKVLFILFNNRHFWSKKKTYFTLYTRICRSISTLLALSRSSDGMTDVSFFWKNYLYWYLKSWIWKEIKTGLFISYKPWAMSSCWISSSTASSSFSFMTLNICKGKQTSTWLQNSTRSPRRWQPSLCAFTELISAWCSFYLVIPCEKHLFS